MNSLQLDVYGGIPFLVSLSIGLAWKRFLKCSRLRGVSLFNSIHFSRYVSRRLFVFFWTLLRFTKRRFWRNSWSLFELDVIILSFPFISYGISSILEAETNTWHISVCLLNCKQPKINKIPFPLLLLFNSNYSLYNLIDKSWSTFINFVSIPIQFTKEKKLHENINTLYNIAPIRNKFSRLHNNLNPEPACQLLTSFPQTHLDFHSKRVYPLFSAQNHIRRVDERQLRNEAP